MSIHEWFIFPRYFHGAQPDWLALERRLLDAEILLPPFGENIARQDLQDLVRYLLPGGFTPWEAPNQVSNTHELVELYKTQGALPASLRIEPAMSMAETLAALREQGVALDERWASDGVRHRLGPGAKALFDGAQSWDEHHKELALTLLQFDEQPFVAAGENLEPPLAPQTGVPMDELEPFGSHIDFIGAVFEDAATTWLDPATGQSHYILDLDWRQTFGMGYRAVKIEHGQGPGDNVFLARLAGLVADLTGEPMVMAHLHL